MWQCKYEIDYDLVGSFNVLWTEIDNIFILVKEMQIMSDSQFQYTCNQN